MVVAHLGRPCPWQEAGKGVVDYWRQTIRSYYSGLLQLHICAYAISVQYTIQYTLYSTQYTVWLIKTIYSQEALQLVWDF